MRHARARTCRIALEPLAGEEEGIRLEVRDDGKGGTVRDGAREGTGLTSMRDRVEGLGGRLERITGDVNGGTAILISLPPRRPAVRIETAEERTAPGGLAVEGAG